MKFRHGVFGVTGWKNSGKTRMVAGLVRELSNRGLRVSTVKHAHHSFDVDHEGRDSWQHREAGASEVALTSRNRWVVMHELRGEPEQSLDAMLARLEPCDIVIVEGYKREPHPKIEMMRGESGMVGKKNGPLYPGDKTIVAIGSDTRPDGCTLPVFDPDNCSAIADFVLAYLAASAGEKPATAPKIYSDKPLLDDCFLHDKDRLKHAEALAILNARLSPIADVEYTSLSQTTGRIAASDITAERPVPPTDNAAVDGYAFRHADYLAHAGKLEVSDRLAAGTKPVDLAVGKAVRIFTGASMPQAADTVAMQEDCVVEDGIVTVPEGLKPGANRRKTGEDLGAQSPIISAGDQLTAPMLAALASTGVDQVPVRKKLKVAILSTGDELIEPGDKAQDHQIFDSNRYLLQSLLSRLPVDVSDHGILPDDRATIENAVAKIASGHDIIITSGGTSMGEEDHILAVLDALGKRHAWQLAIKPGRPMSFGQIGSTVFFGLPGNPVACFVCFLLYARPSLLRLSGMHWHEPRRYPLPAAFEIANKKPDRREFLRGILQRASTGEMSVNKSERDGSGLISGLRESDGLIEIAEDVKSVAKGEMVSFIPWGEFGL